MTSSGGGNTVKRRSSKQNAKHKTVKTAVLYTPAPDHPLLDIVARLAPQPLQPVEVHRPEQRRDGVGEDDRLLVWLV